MDGIILVNKEKGYTSRDVVNVISKVLNTKKVGHFGTLDPMAEGLLVIGVGSYTKIGKFFADDTKEYIATVLIGTSTDTYDTDGNVTEKVSNFDVDKNTIEVVLNKYRKTYLQEVPIYSAVRVNGKRLYEYARNNLKVELPKKEVTIYDINLIDFKENHFTFSCKVSKGTYIRSLINDISKELDIPLCMSALVRTKQDKFLLEDAFTLEDIKNGSYKLLNIRDILDIDVIEVPLELEKRVLNGSKIDRISSKMILFTKDGKDIVLYEPYKEEMKPVLTFKK